jgi:hypothetical protein
MPTVPAFLSARAMRWLNVAVVVWAVFWIGLGTYTGYEVNALHTLSNTVVKAGKASASAGNALEAISNIPLVGGRVGSLAAQAVSAGRSAESSGASSKTTIDQLAILLGLAIGLIPTVPLLSLYIPLLVSWRRDRKAVRRAVEQWDGEPGLDEFLARRAQAHLPFAELRGYADERTGALENRDALAAAELRRLGLDARTRRRMRLTARVRERMRR